MPNNKSIVDYYRARAAEYENIYYRKVPERRKEIEDHCDYVRRISENKTVLDLACGTGYWGKVASKTARELVGVDISIEMIKQAAQKSFGCRADFVVSSLYDLPFGPQSFDLIILGFWLSHEPRQNYENLFKAVTHPLKTDGQIWMIDNNPPAEGPKSESAGADSNGNNLKHRRLENGDEFVIIKNYFETEDLKKIFSGRFRIIEFVHKKYYWSVLLEQK